MGIGRFLVPAIAVGLALAASLSLTTATDGAKKWKMRAGSIEGRVLFPGGAATSSLKVTLNGSVAVGTDRDGNFSFPVVPPGRHNITARFQSLAYQGEVSVAVRSGQVSEAVLELYEVPRVGMTEGVIPLPEWASTFQDLAYDESILLGCDYRSGFTVYDVVDPSNPALIGRSAPGETTCTALLFDYPTLYVGWDSVLPDTGGLAVYSLTDPAVPEIISRVDAGAYPYKMMHAGDLVLGVGRDYFQIFDVSAPGAPRLLSALPYRSEGIAYRDGYAFLGSDTDTLVVLDISDPTTPVEVWKSGEPGEGHSKDCILAGRYLFVGYSEALYLYDVFDPEDPRLVNVVDRVDLEAEGAVLNSGSMGTGRIDVRDWSAYYSGRENGLIAIDYQDVLRPHFSWQSDLQVTYAMNVVAGENLLYIASGPDGLRIVTRR